MGIGEFFLDPRPHGLGHFGRWRRRRLVIEVDHAARAAWRAAMLRHSPMKRSTSDSLVSGPKLMGRYPAATSRGTPIAASTALPFIAPDEQALPAETAMPARSNCTSNDALDPPASEMAPMVGIRGLRSAIINPPACLTPVSSRALSAAMRSRS